MITPSIDLVKQFMDENIGYIVAFFFLNVLALILDTIATSVILSKVFTAIGKKGLQDRIYCLLVQFVCVYIIVRMLNFFRSIVYDIIVPKFFNFLRIKLYNGVLDKYKINYEEVDVGNVLYNFEHLPSSFKRLVTELLQGYIPNILALIVCISYLLYANYKVGLVVLLGTGIFIAIALLSAGKGKKLSEETHDSFNKGNTHINERLNNLFDIYTSGTEESEKKEFKQVEEKLKDNLAGYYRNVTTVITTIQIFVILTLVCSLAIVYHARKNRTMKDELVISTILVLVYYFSYTTNLVSEYMGLTDVAGYSIESDRFISEMKVNSPVRNINKGTTNSPTIDAPIVMNGITFGYNNKTILEDINLTINKNELVAIYGSSGSGKSTMIKLLLGFYGITTGEISVGGINIKEIDTNYLRKNIAVVNQNIRLFDKTVLENMTYGINESNIEDIHNILSDMNIFDKLPNGLNTKVGLAGSNLSGGQKQMISIVRAMLKKTKIIVFDEPTSSLDPNTKEIIIRLIKSLTNRTRIIITHDKEIIKHVDNAYQLVGGSLTKLMKYHSL